MSDKDIILMFEDNQLSLDPARDFLIFSDFGFPAAEDADKGVHLAKSSHRS